MVKEQVPSKNEMENEMEEFIEEGLRNCDFELFYVQGFEVDVGSPEVSVNVFDKG